MARVLDDAQVDQFTGEGWVAVPTLVDDEWITARDTREGWSSANHSENGPPSEFPTSVTWSIPRPSSTPAMTLTALLAERVPRPR